MRLNHLHLVRYGRFTDRRIDLPAAERDFHLILGPNEAGKSTLRAAITDLLYGIPARTSQAFVHAMPDLRLAAGLQPGHGPDAGPLTEVQRTKGNKQTLRDAADQPLADHALAPFIGSTDRAFFGQMFGLDQARMAEGGRSILSASDNLGQVLFQSAAGIASLGRVRDDLQAQADRLWAPRRSRDRQFYSAADALEAATSALKQATVRTRDWMEAQGALSTAEQSHAQLRAQLADLRRQRARLERIRRVLPSLQALASLGMQLQAMGTVAALPASAAQTLQTAERALSEAQVAITHHQALHDEASTALANVTIDHAVLEAAAEIADLDQKRLQHGGHAEALARDRAAYDAHWVRVQTLVAQLGWTAPPDRAGQGGAGSSAPLPRPGADDVRARIPAAPLRAALARLARDNEALQRSAEAASHAVRQKQQELDDAAAALDRLPPAQAPADLQVALQRALKLGDAGAAGQKLQQLADRHAAALDAALAGLGRWRMPVPALQAITPPSADVLQALGQLAVQEAARAQGIAERITRLQQQAEQAVLEARQFQASHDTVSRDELADARAQRDRTWADLKQHPETLPQRGADFELQLATADALADRRHDTVQEATALQSRLAQAERLQLELRQARDEQAVLADASAQREAQWAALATDCGLAGLPFEAAPAWLAARTRALEAAAALADTQADVQRHADAVAAACNGLAHALRHGAGDGGAGQGGAGVAGAGEGGAQALPSDLDRLVLEAETRVQAAANVAGRRAALDQQQLDAQRALQALQETRQDADAAVARWSAAWEARLADAGFRAGADPVAIEAQLALLDTLAQTLAAMHTLQSDRIDRMQADLDRQVAAADGLARRLQPALCGQPTEVIVLALVGALATARSAQQHAQRLAADADSAARQLRDARLRRDQARASLDPLMQQAAAPSVDALRDAVARSDRWHALQADRVAAERAAAEGGDGLSLAQLQAEATGADPAVLVGELAELAARDEALVSALSEAAARRQAAAAAVQAIGGSADAAEAESRRQQALASMADAVERYVKVRTAVRLLAWSIEQYRESRQGPMLAAASTIFAALTDGSFDRLVVDFEHDPPTLQGRRSHGAVVGIEGMSEGTQDQLFLALRLAALDMHLDHATALPFIADDLFVNYDDDRAVAGLRALGELSRKTQVLFLTHHAHLVPLVQRVFGDGVNLIRL